MSKLAVFISQRKVFRKKVTECFNCSERYDSFSASQKLTEQSLLSNYKVDLRDIVVGESDLDDFVL